MIVPMKKAVLITLEDQREQALEELRKVGVVHLEPSSTEYSSHDYTALQNRWNRLDKALSILPKAEEHQALKTDIDAAKAMVDRTLELESLGKELQEREFQILKEIDTLQSWGCVNPEDIKWLEKQGYFVKLYLIPDKEADAGEWEERIFHVGYPKGFLQWMILLEGDEELPPWEEVELPTASIDHLKKEYSEIEGQRAEYELELAELATKELLLQWYKGQLEIELEWEEAKLSFQDDDKLIHLSGFVPEPEVAALQSVAKKEQWGLVLDEPSEEDAVPTKLKQGGFAKLLNPVMGFLGIVPGYRELDISFFFLIFFTIFTSMLIGDAGYGVIFLAAALIGLGVSAAKGKGVPKGLILLLLLSLGTITWGALTGTWFASKALMDIPLLQRLKIPYFTGSDEEMITVIMGVSFLLGVVQLCLGIVQGFLAEFPKLKSFARIGWLAVMIAVYALILTLVIDRQGVEAYPKEMLYLLLGGVAFIFIFGSQEEGQNFFKGIAKSFANFLQNFLDVVGTFSNLMSYVRLFAVGLASVKIAETFNVLAKDMADGWTIVFAILIVVLGHSLNIILGMMAILVHAVRLNILEYSGQIGIEWSGFNYEPFRVRES